MALPNTATKWWPYALNTAPVTDIFIKTFSGDRDYHAYCLASIEKFCTGFRNTVVVDTEHPRGYLMQQSEKLHADLHTDADFILYTDSDTLFNQPVTPETFMVDGKPIWFYTPWTPELLAAVPWFPVMEKFLGWKPIGEFMRRQPFMVPRHVLPDLRDYCWQKHGRTMEQYIMDGTAFSEYNCLGAYCWEFFRDDFHWINTDTDEMPPEVVRQFWSHDHILKNLPAIQQILK